MHKKAYRIPFNKPHLAGKELEYIRKAHQLGHLGQSGYFTKLCEDWMKKTFGLLASFLTTSGTDALEMLAILSGVKPGDEVIMPDYTYVSTANAFVLRGAVPVFVDIRPDTLNIDETQIEKAITKKTKVIMVMHYSGVGCQMDMISDIAKKHKLLILEDAAQDFLAQYKGKYLGTFGDMAAMSFHETKNIISGEGGAVFVSNRQYIDRANTVIELGTNKSKFFMGLVHEYTWVDIGSSYRPGEITAAFLWAQLEKAQEITRRRLQLWNRYHKELKNLEDQGYIKLPTIPIGASHNGHIYRIHTKNRDERNALVEFLKKQGILAVTHYVPLHSSPGGEKYGRYIGDMKATNEAAKTLIRLPLFYDLSSNDQSTVIESIYDFYKHK